MHQKTHCFCNNRNVLLLFSLLALYDVVVVYGGRQSNNKTAERQDTNSLPVNTNKSVLFINPQSVSLRIGGSANISLGLRNGSLARATTFKWQFSGDKQFLLPLADVNLKKGARNLTVTPLKITSNATHDRAGIVTLTVNQTTLDNSSDLSADDAYVVISIYRADWIVYFSTVVGWIYFTAWTLSFYPQVWKNYSRKSVEGLSFNFVALNHFGFICFTAYNGALYWAAVPQAEYRARYPNALLQVKLNDVAFGFHGVAVSFVMIVQCFVYERAGQTVSWPTWVFTGAASVAALVQVIVCAVGAEQWLDLLYYLSYIKLIVTCVKYCPQVYKNFTRKSTEGWSIGNVLLDLIGGLLSLVQMFMLAYNNDDWPSVLFNPSKLGLGLLSIVFDGIFIVQHYCFYSSNGRGRLQQGEDEKDKDSAAMKMPPIAAKDVKNDGSLHKEAAKKPSAVGITNSNFV